VGDYELGDDSPKNSRRWSKRVEESRRGLESLRPTSTHFDPLRRLFQLDLTVAPADIDDLGHVNNIVYLRWVNDVAIAHWKTLGAAPDVARLGWVVTRHELDYKAAAFLGDALTGRTWIGATTAVTCERFVEIRRARDDRLLVASRSIWVAVDRTTGKPKRIEESVLAPLRANGPTD